MIIVKFKITVDLISGKR